MTQQPHKPVDAPLLFDHDGSDDRDERFDDVHLLSVDDDGEAKITARHMRNGWRIADWELTEELEGALGGVRYWFCRSFFTIADADLNALAALAGDSNATRARQADAILGELVTDPELPEDYRERIYSLFAAQATQDLPLEEPAEDVVDDESGPLPPDPNEKPTNTSAPLERGFMGEWWCTGGGGLHIHKAGTVVRFDKDGKPHCTQCDAILEPAAF